MSSDSTNIATTCTLCDAPSSQNTIASSELTFCCTGCHVVYQLLEAKGQLDGYSQHPLFLQAIRSGLISNPALLEQIHQQRSELNDSEREKFYIEIENMWCPSCSEIIRLILLKEKGVFNCIVDYATDLASIEFSPRYISKNDLLTLIESFGYVANPMTIGERRAVSFDLYIRFAVAIFCALNAMMFAYPLYATYFNYDGEGYGSLFAWLSLLSSLPVITYSAWPIWQRLVSSFKVGIFGMEVLVAIGVWTAFGLSTYEMWHGGTYVYFDSMTVIITFVLLGKIIESKAKFSAKDSLFRLSRSMPRKGRKLFEDDTLRFVPAKDIAKGDIIEVYAGEKIPLDGKVLLGEGTCDESLMTGESLPLLKKVSLNVLGGSILVQGWLRIKTTSSCDETALHKIIELVERDIGHKASYVRIIDTIVKCFVPAVLFFAFAAGAAVWLSDSFETAFLRFISILLISCPCAIGIAVPTAESYLLSSLASIGAIVRNRACLNFLGRETVFVFDKTGTATEGIYSVISGLEGLNDEQLSTLKGLTACSVHPAACAIHRAIQGETKRFEALQEMAGFGIQGTLEGKKYLLGSERLMKQLEIMINEEQVQGLTSRVYFSDEDTCFACICLGDRIRPGIKTLVAKLHPSKTILLSGDAEGPVSEVSRECGFDQWLSGKSPMEKREYIADLKQQGEVICMLGDGINDAPALTLSHVGISVVSATDMSMQVSDVLLTTDRIEVVSKIRTLARLGRRIIKQNLFWAFIYNIFGIFLASYGVISPIFAAFAMAMSSLTVLFNARRIISSN